MRRNRTGAGYWKFQKNQSTREGLVQNFDSTQNTLRIATREFFDMEGAD